MLIFFPIIEDDLRTRKVQRTINLQGREQEYNERKIFLPQHWENVGKAYEKDHKVLMMTPECLNFTVMLLQRIKMEYLRLEYLEELGAYWKYSVVLNLKKC